MEDAQRKCASAQHTPGMPPSTSGTMLAGLLLRNMICGNGDADADVFSFSRNVRARLVGHRTLCHDPMDWEDIMDKPLILNARLDPLPADHNPDLKPHFEASARNLGFIPNSMLIMQRRPEIMKAFAAMSASLWLPSSTVPAPLKRLIAHVASRAAGCQYCMAHTAGGALHVGLEEQKLAAIWDYQTSDLFSEAERAALDVAAAAGSVPNGVSDDMFLQLRKYWSEEQIVEIVAVISVFGFLNRWNDTMATPLEDEPVQVGEKFLASHGWTPGKHSR
jgi:uncharacterized peroxidase-related enzyme